VLTCHPDTALPIGDDFPITTIFKDYQFSDSATVDKKYESSTQTRASLAFYLHIRAESPHIR
jgi:hypothetical protein